MRCLDCSLVPLEILHSPGLQVFVLQESPRGRCRLVCPPLFGLPGARLRDPGHEYEAQVQLRSQNFVLKDSSNDIIDMLCYNDRLLPSTIHFLISNFVSPGLVVTGLSLENVQIYIQGINEGM